jgi:hypothetical protein
MPSEKRGGRPENIDNNKLIFQMDGNRAPPSTELCGQTMGMARSARFYEDESLHGEEHPIGSGP